MSLTIETDEQTAIMIQQLAAQENRSVRDVIRDAMTVYAVKRNRQLPKGTGKYQSGSATTAENVDQILKDAVREGLWP